MTPGIVSLPDAGVALECVDGRKGSFDGTV